MAKNWSIWTVLLFILGILSFPLNAFVNPHRHTTSMPFYSAVFPHSLLSEIPCREMKVSTKLTIRIPIRVCYTGQINKCIFGLYLFLNMLFQGANEPPNILLPAVHFPFGSHHSNSSTGGYHQEYSTNTRIWAWAHPCSCFVKWLPAVLNTSVTYPYCKQRVFCVTL